MMMYQYIRDRIPDMRFREMIRIGLIPATTGYYYDVYMWHIEHGRSEAKTTEHFKIPKSTFSHIRKTMKRSM